MSCDIGSQDIPLDDHRCTHNILKPSAPDEHPAMTMIETREADFQQSAKGDQTHTREDQTPRIRNICSYQPHTGTIAASKAPVGNGKSVA